MKPITYYSRKEELWNVLTHLLGLLLSIAGLVLLIVFSSIYGNAWHIVSFSIFGSSMVILYLASSLYHMAKNKKIRRKLNIFDHAAIFVLIAGTYTPFCLVTLNGPMGWTLFGITWGLAIAGIVLKLFFTGKYDLLSTIGYVVLGWIAVIAGKPLLENLDTAALILLLTGGVFYSIGALFYATKKIKYNHAIFHVFVLFGTISHFFTVFYFLL
ncbi:MAG: hemolysin III family protein [bacterium]|nr:hemolysin III family protein [bacterium]